MIVDFFQVDSFTDKPYSGNPAAVCILNDNPTEEWMKFVAREMNLSETAFIVPKSDNSFDLKWFTPLKEVDLCGHATLAAAHILWEKNILKTNENVRFQTRSGLLTCKKINNRIEMDFPAEEVKDATAPDELIEGLKINPLYVGKNRFGYLVEVESEEIVNNLNPELDLLKKVDMLGVAVTSRSDSEKYDFVSRFFAPAYGIDEDPVTGSSHCCLAPYWSKKLGKNELDACQTSKRRGELSLRLVDDRVFIIGDAITVFEGKILY